MRYAKPGPRCSAHARKTLIQAKAHYKEALASGDEKKVAQSKTLLESAVKDYHTTPEGIKRFLSRGDEEKARYYQERRDEMIANFKQAQAGETTRATIRFGETTYRNKYNEKHNMLGPAVIRDTGYQAWYVNGQRHREDGPAVTLADGSALWYLNDEWHRVDGPAYSDADGTQGWYLNGEKHREDGPAIVNAKGDQSWYLNGETHRVGGPAITRADGSQEWWVNGVPHRTDGPAIIGEDGFEEWWVNGERLR